jgi:hypothetical protein
MTRAYSPGDAGTKLLAKFDVELTDEIRLYNMKLIENHAGRRLTYASSSGGQRNATFSIELNEKITHAAVAAFEGRETQHDLQYS